MSRRERRKQSSRIRIIITPTMKELQQTQWKNIIKMIIN